VAEGNLRLNIVSSMLLLLCCLAPPLFSQNQASKPTNRGQQLFACGDWAKASARFDTSEDLDKWLSARQVSGLAADDPAQVVETVKLPYLRGLQYGYLAALEDSYRFLRSELSEDPDEELPSTWSTLLFPRSGTTWANLMGAIDAFCGNPDHATKDLAEAVIAVLNETDARASRIGPDERNTLFVGFGCSQYHEHPRASFVEGYKDGQRVFWLLLRKAGLPDKIPAWGSFLAGLNAHQFELPAGKELPTLVGEFCADVKNKNIPLVFAAKIAAMRARGEVDDADSLLEHFYCSDLPTVWANGRQVTGKTCLGVIVFLATNPALEKPFSYMVGIINSSQSNIEVDWSQWSLAWKDKKEGKLNPALDPDKVAHSIERRSAIAASLAAFGESMSASRPQKAVIIGPQGTSTVAIYPQPDQASAAASQAAAETARPGMELASALSDSSLRRTTLFPGKETGGRIVYFGKPRNIADLSVQVRIPGLPTFSIPVSETTRR
jgi:hypothetical protein